MDVDFVKVFDLGRMTGFYDALGDVETELIAQWLGEVADLPDARRRTLEWELEWRRALARLPPDTPIEEIPRDARLKTRLINVLASAGVTTLGQAASMRCKSLLYEKNFGVSSATDLREFQRRYRVVWKTADQNMVRLDIIALRARAALADEIANLHEDHAAGRITPSSFYERQAEWLKRWRGC